MFIALLGYIGTMVAAFVTLVMVWHHVVGPPQLEAVRQQPRHIGTVTQAAAPPVQPGAWGPAVIHKADESADAAVVASAEDARLAAAQAAAAEKAKRLKQARYQKRKEQEQLARQRDDQQYALGYDQEQRDGSQPSGFGFFGPRRF
jgi:hypothetical protein